MFKPFYVTLHFTIFKLKFIFDYSNVGVKISRKLDISVFYYIFDFEINFPLIYEISVFRMEMYVQLFVLHNYMFCLILCLPNNH